jgi:predicted ArsR family transcriptional regulator
MYEAGEVTVAQIAAEFGVTRPTICRHLDRLDQFDAAGT